MLRCIFAIGSLVLLPFSCPELRADWLHYRGPAQDGTSSETAWALPTNPLKVLWKAKVGTGTSGIVVSGQKAYTMGNMKGKDIIFCLDTATGKPLWQYDYPLELDPNLFEGGPRSTPTLDGRFLYAVSHHGDLFCLDAATGKRVWYTHLFQQHGGRRPDWGYSGSPTVMGKLLVYDAGAGASNIAFDKLTGAVAWKTGSSTAGYASPVLAKVGGVETIILFKDKQVIGVSPKNGNELWSYPWETSYGINAATPLVRGDTIFISSGYNKGCALIRIEKGSAVRVWENKNLRAHINTPVIHNGHIFGIDGNTGGGNLVCLDMVSGETKWEQKTVKGGSLILADGKLIVVTEKGDLVVCEASGNGYKELARVSVQGRRHWTQPTLCDGLLYVRNNDGDLTCIDLRKP